MEQERILQINPVATPIKITGPAKSWSPSLWLYLILLIITIITLWVFTLRNNNQVLPYTPPGFPNAIIRVIFNTLVIIFLVGIAILVTHEKPELLPLFLILLILTITCIIMIEITFTNDSILGLVASFTAVAFLISLSFWSCILPSKVTTNDSGFNYVYTAVLELPMWQIWCIYLVLFIVNIWLLYLAFEMTTLWVKSTRCPTAQTSAG